MGWVYVLTAVACFWAACVAENVEPWIPFTLAGMLATHCAIIIAAARVPAERAGGAS